MLDIIHNIVCTNMKKHRLGTITDRSNKFKYIHVQTNNTFIAASGQRRVTNNQAAESSLPLEKKKKKTKRKDLLNFKKKKFE